MAFDYRLGRVWLDDAAGSAPAGSYPLCEVHASRVSAPRSWTLTDRRTSSPRLPFALE